MDRRLTGGRQQIPSAAEVGDISNFRRSFLRTPTLPKVVVNLSRRPDKGSDLDGSADNLRPRTDIGQPRQVNMPCPALLAAAG